MKPNARLSRIEAADPVSSQTVVEAVLVQVPFEGWTKTSFAAALRQCGMTPDEAANIFPNGMRDVIEYFGAMADAAMQRRIAAERGFDRMRVRDKVAFGVRARLEFLTPYREALRRLMVWYALPQNMASGVRRFYKTVDTIWIAAGDTATDYNFYTKRFLLASVLKATTLFWLNDETSQTAATWDFLDRRISEVMKLGKSISLLREFTPSELFEAVRKKVRKVI